jgi:hypothetical protein
MKNLFNVFYKVLTVACFVLFLSCSSDDDASPTSSTDPNVFCDREFCSTNANLKQICIDEYNDCTANTTKTDEQCAALAAETCGA